VSKYSKTETERNHGAAQTARLAIEWKENTSMDEQKMPRRPRRSSTEEQPKNESLVYGKTPVTELLKSGSGVDTVLIAEGMAPAVAAY